MGILSIYTEVLFGIVAATALILLLVFWNKFSKHNFRNVTARISIIIFINVFTLSSIGVGLNRYGDFYASWSDLFGINQNLAPIALAPKDVTLITHEEIAKADKTKDGALIFKKIITGESSRISNYVYVVASPSLAKVLEAGQNISTVPNYQIEELFSGYPGVPQTWIGSLGAIHTMSVLDNEGKIPPTLAVIPEINVVPRSDTECLNIPNVADVETWITSDMVTFLKSFMGIDSRLWSVFGYSTGGWCSVEVAMRHPDIYKNSVVLAGYYKPQFSTKINRDTRNALTSEYDLVSLARSRFENPPVLIIYSTQDRGAFGQMKEFTTAVKGYVSTPIITIPLGGHNIQVWKPFVAPAFIWANTGRIDLNAATAISNGQTPVNTTK